MVFFLSSFNVRISFWDAHFLASKKKPNVLKQIHRFLLETTYWKVDLMEALIPKFLRSQPRWGPSTKKKLIWIADHNMYLYHLAVYFQGFNKLEKNSPKSSCSVHPGSQKSKIKHHFKGWKYKTHQWSQRSSDFWTSYKHPTTGGFKNLSMSGDKAARRLRFLRVMEKKKNEKKGHSPPSKNRVAICIGPEQRKGSRSLRDWRVKQPWPKAHKGSLKSGSLWATMV